MQLRKQVAINADKVPYMPHATGLLNTRVHVLARGYMRLHCEPFPDLTAAIFKQI